MYRLPSIISLIAFEAVARLQGFARAAEELKTSQPTISRHIRNLEIRFGTVLFHRDKTPISLPSTGSQLYAGVVQGFDALQSAVQTLEQVESRVTLVCSHSVSHLLLIPRYGRLRQALGRDVELRVMTAEYNLVQAAVETGGDIIFVYAADAPDEAHVVVCEEEIKPVGTPENVAQALNALQGRCYPPPLLKLKKENFGWMDWQDWHAAHPEFAHWPVTDEFDSYVYLLEAAAAGAGLGLGWKSFADVYLDRNDLIELPIDWLSKDTKVFACLTRCGQQNPIAHKCLTYLEGLCGL
jgi:LysR family glycine cleavage system transcriptional activator